jgi:hypothetical protein
MEKKTYYLGYNRYSNQVIVYSLPEHAERSNSYWKTIQSHSLEEAKKQFLEEYLEANTEHE